MRAVVTRVCSARVETDGRVAADIGRGYLALVGVARTDTAADADWISDRICKLRGFEDQNGKMNLSPEQAGASLLLVSNFTLYADCAASRRPSFSGAAGGDEARALFDRVVESCRLSGLPVETGVFGAEMAVSSVNDGPVTFILDSAEGVRP